MTALFSTYRAPVLHWLLSKLSQGNIKEKRHEIEANLNLSCDLAWNCCGMILLFTIELQILKFQLLKKERCAYTGTMYQAAKHDSESCWLECLDLAH